jgi:hypothetical protein
MVSKIFVILLFILAQLLSASQERLFFIQLVKTIPQILYYSIGLPSPAYPIGYCSMRRKMLPFKAAFLLVFLSPVVV